MEGEIEVECYSGHRYAQEPRAFTWHGQRYEIERVDQARRTPRGPVFRVWLGDGRRFTLAYDEIEDHWTIGQEKAPGPRSGPSGALGNTPKGVA